MRLGRLASFVESHDANTTRIIINIYVYVLGVSLDTESPNNGRMQTGHALRAVLICYTSSTYSINTTPQ